MNRLTDNAKMSVAEARYICGTLRLLRNVKNQEGIDALEFPQCRDMIFMDKYLLYFDKHEVWFGIIDYDGEVSLEQKRKDVLFLEEHYLDWEKNVIQNTRLSDEKLRHISIETNRQIKSLKEYCKSNGLGHNRFKHLQKGVILHSKFLYYTVLEFYEEGNPNEEAIEICNHRFVIDSFVYIHVLFRHYAEVVKEHQHGKSYHSIDHFDYKNIPTEILSVLTKYKAIANCQAFDMEKIFFDFQGQLFALWYKEIVRQRKNKPKEIVVQIQTLYPVKEQRDLLKISKLTRLQLDNEIAFFV